MLNFKIWTKKQIDEIVEYMQENYRDFEAKLYIDQLYGKIENKEMKSVIQDTENMLQKKILGNKVKIGKNIKNLTKEQKV